MTLDAIRRLALRGEVPERWERAHIPYEDGHEVGAVLDEDGLGRLRVVLYIEHGETTVACVPDGEETPGEESREGGVKALAPGWER